MRGNVIGFDPDTNTGAISGHDGNRYDFVTQDWHGRGLPRHGDIVDFDIEGQRAHQIYLIEPEYVPPTFTQFYFSAAGRISRSQYWLKYVLPVFIIACILNIIAFASGGALKFLPNLFQLIMLWPGIAILIKRIHDRNKSGWLVAALYGPLVLALIFIVAGVAAVAASGEPDARPLFIIGCVFGAAAGIVGIWFFVEFGCMRGTIGANQYGPDPVR